MPLVPPVFDPRRVTFSALRNSGGLERINHKGRSEGAEKVKTRLTSLPNRAKNEALTALTVS